MVKYYVKWPNPGQFRGEGDWQECDLDYYEWCEKTGYLPVKKEEDDT